MKKYLVSFCIETEVGPKILNKVVRSVVGSNAMDILNALFDEYKGTNFEYNITLINFWPYE